MRRPLVRRGDSSLEHYDPKAGVVRIAVQEQAEKHWRRAKDATRLLEAIELKLSEQRNFVLWWDSVERRGRPKKNTGDPRFFLKDFGLDDDVVGTWRVKLTVETRFDATLARAQQKAILTCEFRKGSTDQRGASGTGMEEWYTPAEYIEAARDVLGSIDLDPASSAMAQGWIKAERFFTVQADGLAHPWPGRIWLNPPYTQPDVAHFVEKLCAEVEVGNTLAAILLTHNYTDTAWFHRAAGVCAAICFTRGRIAFLSPTGEEAAPTQGQAFFYFGPDVDRFAARFTSEGFVVVPR